MGSPVGLVGPTPPPDPAPAPVRDVLVRPRAGAVASGRGRACAPAAAGPGALRTGLLVLAGAWLALLGGLLWWTNLPLLVGWQPRVVLTGSMMPGIVPGDVVLMAPAPDPLSLPAGRIVVVDDPTRPSGSYAHRIQGHEDGRIVTKGDANPTADNPAVDPSRVLGEIRMVVPRVGLPLVWARAGDLAPIAFTLLWTWASLVVVLHGAHPVAALRARTRRRP